MSNIEFFGIFGFFILSLLLMVLSYAFIFLLYLVTHSIDWEDTEVWLVTTLAFITIMAMIFTQQYAENIHNNTVSENVVETNAGD